LVSDSFAVNLRAFILLAVLCPALRAAEPPPPSKPLLPDSLIVTYYGNPFSKRMGILGEIPPEAMMARLQKEADLWQKADSSSTVRPGLELVTVVSADYAQQDNTYRYRMPKAMIEKVMGWARSRGWLIILDVQVGRSSVKKELDWILPYLEQPDVHLALDPEFQMAKGLKPGRRIGSSDAEDVNLAVIYLSKLVQEKKLPPKLLLVHRFTDDMLKRYWLIRQDPNVQIVVVMDGFGSPFSKAKIYRREVAREPVQFGGIKLFYKNDQPMMSRRQVLELQPRPRVVIYQ
jgi:hypothetical protein